MKKNLLLLFSSLLLCAALGLLLELGVRVLMPGVNFQDTDAGLFVTNAVGESIGWRPGANGVSFGLEVRIDDNGFRDTGGPDSYETSWLVLGDSVTFGVGVEAEHTFPAMLQRRYPDIKIWDTGVVGYSVLNYRDVMRSFMQSGHSPRRVFIFLTLNDLYGYFKTYSKPESLRAQVISFLLRHSKLFLAVKGSSYQDASRAHFLYDFNKFKNPEEELHEQLGALKEMAGEAKAKGVEFVVFILPYEYQLRGVSEEYLLPQKTLSHFFEENCIAYIDAYERFAGPGIETKKFYLYGDAMHLSVLGHEKVFGLVEDYLDGKLDASGCGSSAQAAGFDSATVLGR